jgi:O6-methylguanine-DNA--protein-cysteine methyltransferase
MTAKEQLRERIEELTEDEAAEALRLLDQRTDALTRLLDDAPLDDEPTTPEEEAAVQEALEAAARGETISLKELRAELDTEPR